MFRLNTTTKTSLFFIALLAVSPYISAKTVREGDPRKESRKNISVASKTLEIKQSNQSIELSASNGASVSLPLIEKVLVDQQPLPNSKLLAHMDKGSFGIADLQEKLIEQKEIYELSKELGIQIKDSRYLDLYREVIHWIGIPYRYGAMSSKAVDCSGFTGLVFKAVYDRSLPRVSADMSKHFNETVTKNDLEPGDLVFFATKGKKRINHVGIFLGDRKFVHASRSKGVMVSSLDDPYFVRSWNRGAKVEE